MKRAIVFTVILMFAHICLATTIHVPAERPTIQAGIDAAVNGDTVLVAPGSYPERINFRGKGIVVTSSNGPKVTFLNPSSTPVVLFITGEPSSAELCGFTFQNISGWYLVEIGNGCQPLIKENVFASLVTSDLIIYCHQGHPRIVRNIFHDNLTGGACIGVGSGGGADIINNTFDGNGSGFYSFGSTVAKNNIITNSTE
jgi:serine protease